MTTATYPTSPSLLLSTPPFLAPHRIDVDNLSLGDSSIADSSARPLAPIGVVLCCAQPQARASPRLRGLTLTRAPYLALPSLELSYPLCSPSPPDASRPAAIAASSSSPSHPPRAASRYHYSRLDRLPHPWQLDLTPPCRPAMHPPSSRLPLVTELKLARAPPALDA